MGRRFNIVDYGTRTVMHCDTEQKAEVFTRYLDQQGMRWCSGQSYRSLTMWQECGVCMCYCFQLGTYSSRSFYRKEGYVILEFDDFDWGDKLQDDEDDQVDTPLEVSYNCAMGYGE